MSALPQAKDQHPREVILKHTFQVLECQWIVFQTARFGELTTAHAIADAAGPQRRDRVRAGKALHLSFQFQVAGGKNPE